MPKIIQINGKVNLIKNHVKIKTVSHRSWLRSFRWAWRLVVKISARREKIQISTSECREKFALSLLNEAKIQLVDVHTIDFFATLSAIEIRLRLFFEDLLWILR